jgi:hypothetical protein
LDPNTGASIQYQAVWPGAMAIFAGVDLLGKFYAGNDATDRVGDRFRGFLEAFSIGQNPVVRETRQQFT